MPELPEVESIRRYLEKNIVSKTIYKVDALTPALFHGDPNNVVGQKIIDVVRNGKVLAIEIDDNSYLSFHFKLSGQLLYSPNASDAVFTNVIPLIGSNKLPGKSTRVIFYFSDGSGLFFNEMRMFGWVKHSKQIEGPKGVDILSKEFTEEYFTKSIAKTRRAIKIALLDQDKFAGIGNIYANEALFEANINPQISANNLTTQQYRDLYLSILKVIEKGIRFRGSSGRDEVYVLPDGSKGEYQKFFKVYQRDGDPCKICGDKIMRIKLGGRGTFYCPNCQDNKITIAIT